jgi:hypothetical protein
MTQSTKRQTMFYYEIELEDDIKIRGKIPGRDIDSVANLLKEPKQFKKGTIISLDLCKAIKNKQAPLDFENNMRFIAK